MKRTNSVTPRGDDAAAAWPIQRHQALLLVVAYCVLVGVGLPLGLVIRNTLATGTNPLARLDVGISEWFASRRTPTLNQLSSIPSWFAGTGQAIILMIILTGVIYWAVSRWREPAAIVAGMALEAVVFLTISLIVSEARPPVSHLDPVPPTGSFPSGHVGGACALYLGLALAVHSATDRRWLRMLSWGAAVLLPLSVAWSRLYRGMHFFTDVVVGAILGTLCALAAWMIVARRRSTPARS